MKHSKITSVWKSALYRTKIFSRFFSSPFIPHILFFSCILFTLYLAFFKLGNAPLENWDEAWYAEVTKQMLLTKEFIVPHWNHAVWLDKPPLYMWLTAILASIFGLNEFSVRFVSALSGSMVIILVVWYTYRKWGIVPSLLAFSSLALNNVFVWRMRSGNIDTLATLLILLVFFLQVSKHKYKYVLLGLLFSLIYLTRASLVMYPLSIFLLQEIIFERKKLFKKYKEYLKLIATFLFIPVIWLFLGSLHEGAKFWQYYVLQSDRGVAAINLIQFNPSYHSYLYYALQRRFYYIFLIGVGFSLRYCKNITILLPVLYTITLLVQLSFTERSNNWYLIPSMPFWSMLTAFGTYHLIGIFRKNFFLILGILLVSLYISYRTFIINIMPILNTSSTNAQAQSSKQLRQLTKSNEVIIRLDHLYPTTIYYSDRKILASPEESDKTKEYWISRHDVFQAVRKKKIRWLLGENNIVKAFMQNIPDVKFKVKKVNAQETILEVL